MKEKMTVEAIKAHMVKKKDRDDRTEARIMGRRNLCESAPGTIVRKVKTMEGRKSPRMILVVDVSRTPDMLESTRLIIPSDAAMMIWIWGVSRERENGKVKGK